MTAVYRLYDSEARLLYVGVTEHLLPRLSEHRRQKPWWDKVAIISTERYAVREDALRRESEVIRNQEPAFNITQPTRQEPRPMCHRCGLGIQTTPPGKPAATDLVGVVEVARLSGLSEASVRTYVRRRTLPAPIPVEGSDALVWSRAEIEEWARTRPGPGRPSLGRDHHTNAGF